MKKSIKKLSTKKIENTVTVKGGLRLTRRGARNRPQHY